MSEKTSGESPVNPLPIAAAVYPTNEPFDASAETTTYSRSEAHDKLLSLGYTGGVAERFLNDAAHTLETMEPTSSAAKVLRAYLRNPLARRVISRAQAAKELRALGVGDYSTVQLLDNAQAWLSGENGPLVEAFAAILRAYVRGLEAHAERLTTEPDRTALVTAATADRVQIRVTDLGPVAPADRVTEDELAEIERLIRQRDANGGRHADFLWTVKIERASIAMAPRLAAEVRALRAVIVRANNLLFEVQPDVADAEHAIECHAVTVPAAYLRLAKGASAAADVLALEVCEMLEPTLRAELAARPALAIYQPDLGRFAEAERVDTTECSFVTYDRVR